MPTQRRAMNVRQAMRERARARSWFQGLRRDLKDALGDEFVLGTFDWRNWFDRRPTNVFLREVERERMLWESEEWA